MISGVSESPWSAAARDAFRSGVRVRKMAGGCDRNFVINGGAVDVESATMHGV